MPTTVASVAAGGSDEALIVEPPSKRQRVQLEPIGTAPIADPAGLMAVCYFCVIVNQRGKFLPQKATALGVPKYASSTFIL